MITLPYIDYSTVHKAIEFYVSIGYKYIEVPWVVSEAIIEITRPVSSNKDEHKMVASGEQGFLAMAYNGSLSFNKKYVCATPCYRPWDIGKSSNHYSQFFKIEIAMFGRYIYLIREYSNIISDVYTFMSRYCTDCYVTEEIDEKRNGCKTLISHDIYEKDLEIGSCGIRFAEDIGYWIYATGAALPRLLSNK